MPHPSSQEGSAFDKKMNVVGKRMQDSIRMLDAGALYTNTNKQDPNLPSVPPKIRAKLAQSLEKPIEKSRKLSESQKGSNAAQAEDILEIMQDVLGSKKLRGLFKGTDDASAAVEFANCKVNADVSHVYIEWTSPLLTEFAQELKDTMGNDHAKRFCKKSTSFITGKLASREAVFRTELMRAMFFKRVPRIYFKSESPTLHVSFVDEDRRGSVDDLIERSLHNKDA